MSDGARFCERCGAALTATAVPLRAPSSLEAKILAERTGIQGERKQVTVLYTDIVRSMELTYSLDNERWGFVLDHFLAIAAGAVHAFEGTVNQFTGDGLLAVFGAPLAHEDHARRACLAALALQAEVVDLAADVAERDGADFAIRSGLNSGEVVVGEIGDDVQMDFVPIGNTTALGKRIESMAPVGSTAISASTASLVEGEFELHDLGEFGLKGTQEPQRVFELLRPSAARTRLEATAATRGLSRFVGRDSERAELESALDDALAGRGRAVGIVGDPGVGKSRLVHEFVADCAARGVTVNSTGGVAHARFIPFLPVLALYRDYFAVDELDAPEVARERIENALRTLDPSFAPDLALLFEFLGVSDPDRPLAALDPEVRQRRLLDLTTRLVQTRSQHEAAVLVVEDLHWIDDASAAFVEALVEAVVGTRILLVGTYRPEYEDAWTGDARHSRVSLDPLKSDASSELLAELLGSDPSLDGLRDLIQERTGGNPFFIEEIVQALTENGNLLGARGAYRLAGDLEGLVLPATVEAGIAARIDRLPAREKVLVQTMAVIGGEVPGPLLGEVSDLGAHQLAEAISVLASAQLVIPESSSGSLGYVFKHPLTQDVAYGSQLSEGRARAHRTVAAAIERTYPDGLDERAALLAHHYEASDDTLEAARWHARAAAWAGFVSPAEAMRHWRRVRDLVESLEETAEVQDLATDARTGVLRMAWRIGASGDERAAILDEAGAGDVDVRPDPHYAGFLMHNGREREGLEAFRAITGEALAVGDPGWLLTVSSGVAYASWVAGSVREGVDMMDRALQTAGDDPKVGTGLAFVCPLAHAHQSRGLCRGYMGELEEARRDFDRAVELARAYEDAETESATHANRALVEAELGNRETALESAALGLEIAERSGNSVHVIACKVPTVLADAGAGRFAEALAEAESNLAAIHEHEIGLYYEPVLLATIARCMLALGRPGEALTAAQSAVKIMDARGLATCALQAPIALAQVLASTEGVAAAERIDAVLARMSRVIETSGAQAFAPHLQREREALAVLPAS